MSETQWWHIELDNVATTPGTWTFAEGTWNDATTYDSLAWRYPPADEPPTARCLIRSKRHQEHHAERKGWDRPNEGLRQPRRVRSGLDLARAPHRPAARPLNHRQA